MKESLHQYLQNMQDGEEQAFRYVYDQTKDHVYRMVRCLSNRESDVCDIVNEVYLALVRSLPRYDRGKPFDSWLNGLIIRQTRSWNRKLWRAFRITAKEQQLMSPEEGESADRHAAANERSRELAELLGGLSFKLRTVVVLRYYRDLTFAEIAETLDIPIGTVKSRHDAAMKKLRVSLTVRYEGKEDLSNVY